MLVLATPFFENELTHETFNIDQDRDVEHQKIDLEIIKILSSKFRRRNIYRLPTTGTYAIETLQNETIDDITDVYFSKLRDPITVTFILNKVKSPTIVTFNTYEIKPDEDYDTITDEQLSNYNVMNVLTSAGLQLYDLNLDNVFLNSTAYAGVNFYDTSLLNAQVVNAKLFHSNFNDTKLRGANLNEADLRFSTFKDADLSQNRRSVGKTSLVNANLRYANFERTNFTGADLTGADFRYAIFDSETNFTDCTLLGTQFSGDAWQGTIYTPGSMQAAIFSNEEPDEEEEEEVEEDGLELEDDATIEDEADEGDKNICFDYIYGDEKNISKYLQKNPSNLVIKKTNGEFECESLNSLRKQYKNEGKGKYKYYGYYECSKDLMDKVKRTGVTPMDFGVDDYDATKEYVKIGSALTYIEKPEWMYAGPPPEPRIFELVSTGLKKYLVEKSLTKKEANLLSGVHCDIDDNFEIFTLVPVDLAGSMAGGKHKTHSLKRTKKRNNKKTLKKYKHKKTLKKYKHKKTLKKYKHKKTLKKYKHKKTLKKYKHKKTLKKHKHKKTLKKHKHKKTH